MPYATPEEIIELYSEDALSRIADSDGDFIADPAKIKKAIKQADAEIDAYIGVRFSLPLVSIPPVLTQLSSDIAVYRLATEAGAQTEDHRTRYKDARAFLVRISEGKATLQFTAPPADDANGDEPAAPVDTSPRPIVTSGPPRLFTRDKLSKLR